MTNKKLPETDRPRTGVVDLDSMRQKLPRPTRARKPGAPKGNPGATTGNPATSRRGADAISAGNLALAAQQRPTSAPAPSRWFSDKNSYIGFRLWDIVYLFALACQALEPEDAIEWGARYFSGALNEEHGRAVLDVLSPGEEAHVTAAKLHVEITDSFRRAIRQGLRELLGKAALEPEQVDKAAAYRVQHLLEAMYEANGWLLPGIPLTLHRMLRKGHLLDY